MMASTTFSVLIRILIYIMPSFFNVLSWTLASTVGQRVFAAPAQETQACHPSSFSFPNITGTELINIDAQEVLNYTKTSLLPGTDSAKSYNLDFCNITVTYKHVDASDSINVFVWAPMQEWNGRLLGLGGGGFAASFGYLYQTAGVGKGFVAIGTDSGHAYGQTAGFDTTWALDEKNNTNWELVKDWSSRTLLELSIIGKHTTKEFFGRSSEFNYFAGCSAGGRQGLALAQLYPQAFDGILAAAPAINIETFVPATYWPTQVMNDLGVYPPPCEIQAFTKAAIEQCDGLDGVVDGIISLSEQCHFEASRLIGESFYCNRTQRKFTKAGAFIVEAAWNGVHSEELNWFGFGKNADLTEAAITTKCDSNSENCRYGTTNGDLYGGWFSSFAAKDPDFDVSSMNTSTFYSLLSSSSAEFRPYVGSDNPDLRAFQAAGGKLITWHGMADTTIPPGGSSSYYERALKANNNTTNFYRHFEAPGVGHCKPGAGLMPDQPLEQLMAWVEHEIKPKVLTASSKALNSSRPLCPYPSKQAYVGSDPNVARSFVCV